MMHVFFFPCGKLYSYAEDSILNWTNAFLTETQFLLVQSMAYLADWDQTNNITNLNDIV